MLPVVIEQARCLLAHCFIVHVEVADSKQPVQLHPLYQPLTTPIVEVKRLYTNMKRSLKSREKIDREFYCFFVPRYKCQSERQHYYR